MIIFLINIVHGISDAMNKFLMISYSCICVYFSLFTQLINFLSSCQVELKKCVLLIKCSIHFFTILGSDNLETRDTTSWYWATYTSIVQTRRNAFDFGVDRTWLEGSSR